jgi:hypothetical protein
MAALNAGDEPALLATLHFPHYRLAGCGCGMSLAPGVRSTPHPARKHRYRYATIEPAPASSE